MMRPAMDCGAGFEVGNARLAILRACRRSGPKPVPRRGTGERAKRANGSTVSSPRAAPGSLAHPEGCANESRRTVAGPHGAGLPVAAAGVVVAIGVAAALALLANRGTVDVRLGSDTFAEHDAEDAARTRHRRERADPVPLHGRRRPGHLPAALRAPLRRGLHCVRGPAAPRPVPPAPSSGTATTRCSACSTPRGRSAANATAGEFPADGLEGCRCTR